MKPIKLQFAGLNSYRTRQVIDFQTLGADGLFGIFGPTGSGKSTIPDAITLALYGGVDRTINNTRGIIHQLENSLEVSFQFQLGECRYLVDRRYERNPKDPEAAMAKQARLRRLGSNDEEVLASKPQEVNAKIEEILGIRRDEFLRAVVLPQGKFDQFLRMTGGDRAAMLEHLFNLEQFGEDLAAKVKNEASVCSEQLQKIAGEEQGLGDCSEAAVTEALSILHAKKDEYLYVQRTFETIDKSHQEAVALRELFQKQDAAMKKQAELEQKRETVEEKQVLLNSAERAEPFRELLMRQKELRQKIAIDHVAYQKNTVLHNEAANQHEKAKAELESAEKSFNMETPKLQAQKTIYQGAWAKQSKLLELQNNAREKQKELDGIAGETNTFEKQIQSHQGQLVNIRTTLATLQKNREQFIVDPGEKEMVSRATEVLLHLEENEKRLEDQTTNHTNRKVQNDHRFAEVAAKVREMLPKQAILPGDDIEAWTKSLLSQAETGLENARTAHQHALIMNSVTELVKQLHDGEPCPVCGSRQHPQPAATTGETAKLEAAVQAAEKRLKEIQRWEGQVLKIWREWATNEPLVREAQDEMVKAQKEHDGLLADWENVRGRLDRDGLYRRKQQLIEFEKQLQQYDQRRDELLKAQEEVNSKLLEFTGHLQVIKVKDAAAREAVKNLNLQIDEISGELQAITGGRDLISLIQETDQTVQRLQRIVDNGKRVEGDARSTVERLVTDIAALEATLQVNRGELAGIEQRLSTEVRQAGFGTCEEVEMKLLSAADRLVIRRELEAYRQEAAVAQNELNHLASEIGGRSFDEAVFTEIENQRRQLFETVERLKAEVTLAQNKVEELQKKQERWNELQKQKKAAQKRQDLAEELGNLLRGRKFVSFLAQEHLRDMALEASYQLGRLTGQRYALELAKDKDCEFVIRDDYNGGNRRMINSLSGGEIFLTSLALALALSSKIQLRGRYPLGFFFLDEGFGTLDEEKLDKVMTALEKLHDKNRMVGVISHVRELKERLPRYLEVTPAAEDGSGSEIKYVGN